MYFKIFHPKAQPVNCVCEHQEQMYLQLRGLCPDSNIDLFYIIRNKKGSSMVELLGFKNTIIEYEELDKVWKLKVHDILENTSAVSESPMASYVLGTNAWVIENDNYDACHTKGMPHTKFLKLTGCREGEFTCSDGQCIRKAIIYHISDIM